MAENPKVGPGMKDAAPVPNPGEKDKRYKRVGPNKWREVKEGVTGKTVPGKPWRELYDKKERAFREKKHQDYLKQKGFNVKRDKGGSGFSMSIGKKIKGFEETDMGTKTIDEAEGIKTVSTKGYTGSRKTKPSNRPGTKGFVNFKGGKPAAEADHAVLAHHKSEAAKEGKVVQLRYRGPRSHAGRHTYNPGASQIRGSATGAAIYYKDKSEIGGRQRAAKYGRKYEEYEMAEEKEIEEGLRPKISASGERSIDRRDKLASGKVMHVTGFRSARGAEEEAKKKWDKTASRFDKARAKLFGVKYTHEETQDEYEMDEATKKSDYYTSPDRDDRRSERGPPDPIKTSGRRSKTRQARAKAGPNFPVKEEVEMEEEEDQEPMTEVSDLVVHAIDQRPLEFQQSFADLMQQRIEDAVHGAKLEIAAGFVANTEPIDVDFEDEEADDEDWDGTEYEGEEEDDLTPGEPEEASGVQEEDQPAAKPDVRDATRPAVRKLQHKFSAKYIRSGKVPTSL